MPTPTADFDEAYYERFYRDPSTRAATPREVTRHIQFVVAYLAHLEVPIRSVLDLGCGIGMMRDALAIAAPMARYQGVENSEFACHTYGWEHGSVIDYRSRRRHDLVICHDVIQYLGNRDAAEAIDNLARLSTHALLLAVLTREDHAEGTCDPQRTDLAVRLRSTSWYRRRLRPHFVNVGGGLFLKREQAPSLWSLEHID